MIQKRKSKMFILTEIGPESEMFILMKSIESEISILVRKCLLLFYNFKVSSETHSTCAECMWQYKEMLGEFTSKQIKYDLINRALLFPR